MFDANYLSRAKLATNGGLRFLLKILFGFESPQQYMTTIQCRIKIYIYEYTIFQSNKNLMGYTTQSRESKGMNHIQ